MVIVPPSKLEEVIQRPKSLSCAMTQINMHKTVVAFKQLICLYLLEINTLWTPEHLFLAV